MRINLTHNKSITQLATLALFAICLTLTTAHAQPEYVHFVFNKRLEFGIAPGQTARYTWANLNDPDPRKREFEPSRILVRLLAADGSVIAQDEGAAVGAGQFQSFDFNRDRINLTGEPGTGRLQARLEVTVIGTHRVTDITLKRGVIGAFDDAVEIIDNSSGRTTVSPGGGVNAIVLNDTPGKEFQNPKTFQIISAGKDHLIGIVSGQTLRISVFNPLAPPPPGADSLKFKMLFAPLILLADGSVVAQGDEIALDPGEFHSFDFKRADLPLAGVPGADRLQARVEIRRRFFPGFVSRFPQGDLDGAPTVVEIVDDSTGKTTTLSSKPKEIVVVGSK
jgi:hypothetical protein